MGLASPDALTSEAGGRGGSQTRPVRPQSGREAGVPLCSPAEIWGMGGMPAGSRRSCACERTSSEWCKSTPYQRIQYVADCNCVAARRGGEQRKANNQSAGDELDLAGTCDELASVGRSPEQQLMPPPGALGRTGPTGHLRMGPLLQACRADQDVDRKATTRRVQVVRGGMVGRRCDPALRDRESCPKQRRDYAAGQQSEPP